MNGGAFERPSFVETAEQVRCMAGVLVGGDSTRMGRAKATLRLPDGKTMVEHVAGAALSAGYWVEGAVILGHVDRLPASLAGLRALADVELAAGPLSGLCSLLEYARPRWGLLLACDMPRLQPSLLERLRAAVRPGCDAVAFRRIDRPDCWHTCCALYHPRLLPAALQELKQGRRSLQNLLATAVVASIDPASEDSQMLSNVNTSEDYDRLLQDT